MHEENPKIDSHLYKDVHDEIRLEYGYTFVQICIREKPKLDSHSYKVVHYETH